MVNNGARPALLQLRLIIRLGLGYAELQFSRTLLQPLKDYNDG
jgi:hypothetical protein